MRTVVDCASAERSGAPDHPCSFSIGPEGTDGFRSFHGSATVKPPVSLTENMFLIEDSNSGVVRPCAANFRLADKSTQTFGVEDTEPGKRPPVMFIKSEGPTGSDSVIRMAYDYKPVEPSAEYLSRLPKGTADWKHFQADSIIESTFDREQLANVDCGHAPESSAGTAPDVAASSADTKGAA